jgi:putative DNA primase/helicase
MGYLFADTYKNICRYVSEAKEWYVYDGRIWKIDAGALCVSKYAKMLTYSLLDVTKDIATESQQDWLKFVARMFSNKSRDAMIESAKSVYYISHDIFDKNIHLFNCQNGTLNLNTGEFKSHNPNDFICKISNVIYNPECVCERWDRFIDEIMQGDIDTAKFLQKSLGYSLTGDTSEEIFTIFYGSTTRNGKGTTCETMIHLMGDYGRTVNPETIAQKQTINGGGPSEDIARLRGARFVNMSEPDKGLRLNAALIKQLTGGDTILARFMYQGNFEFKPEFKIFINTNHRIKINDDSIFSSGRLHEIPFERHFEESEQDKGLKSFFKQSENISGIFNWLYSGLKLMKEEGLIQPKAVINSTKQYRDESDIIGQFINECLVYSATVKTPFKDIYSAYESWCKGYGYAPLNNRNMTSDMRHKGLNVDKGTGNKTYLFEYGLVIEENISGDWL